MPSDVPEGSIVITPGQFYRDTTEALVEIKLAVSGLPELHNEVKELKTRVGQLEKFRWQVAGVAGLASAMGAYVLPQVFNQ